MSNQDSTECTRAGGTEIVERSQVRNSCFCNRKEKNKDKFARLGVRWVVAVTSEMHLQIAWNREYFCLFLQLWYNLGVYILDKNSYPLVCSHIRYRCWNWKRLLGIASDNLF